MAAPRNIRLPLAEYAPPAVLAAPTADRRAFLARLAELAVHLKRADIRRGIGADGKPFLPVKRPRPDGATGKPLDPHGVESRTYRLLAAHVGADFVTLFWRGHGRKSWTTILGYHADGLVKGAPVRDEFGLAPRTQRQLRAEMAAWWGRTQARAKPKGRPRPPGEGPAPKPAPRPRPKPPRPAAARPAPPPPEPTVTRRGRVVYLPPGARPNPLSRRIQVIEAPTPKAPRLAPSRAASPGAPAPPVAPPPGGGGPASSERILPGRPIRERIAAYSDGQERVKQLQALGSDAERIGERLAAQQARAEQAMRRWEQAAAGPEKDALAATMRAEESAALLLKAEHFQAERAARQAAQDVLATGRRFHLGAEYPPRGLSDDQKDTIGEGLRWLQRNVAPPAEGRGSSHVAPMLVPIKPLQRGRDRPYCDDKEIRVDKTIDAPTVVHEVGHYLDFHSDGFDRSAREFLKARIEGETPRKLREVLGGSYKEWETGCKDHFDDAFGADAWYAGKAYHDGMTEITSMGLEQLYRDPVGFARKDPEYATYLIGVLHGPLR